jgi:dethiobiotin synthase
VTPARIIFVTGTDTGVGKTLFTALLLAHLRGSGVPALAVKPFCSGTRADAELLASVQDGELTIAEVNPFYFEEPVAPLVACRGRRRSITLSNAVEKIQSIAKRLGQSQKSGSGSGMPPCLLVEGSGGLLVPLGKNYSVLDLILALRCRVIVLSRNKLGTLNHTLLTVQALTRSLGEAPPGKGSTRASLGERDFRSSLAHVVLMNTRQSDVSCGSNPQLLSELLAPIPVLNLPWLGPRLGTPGAIRVVARGLETEIRGVAIPAVEALNS